MEIKSHPDKQVMGNKLMLIVEDEVYNIDFIVESLKDTKLKCLIAHDGKTAIEIINKTPDISMVMLDIRLPDISGLDVAREIRKQNKEIIIVAQTAYAGEYEKSQCLEAGCNDFITKPIQKQTILKLVKRYISN